ncbi:Putative protease [Ignavibacterium album JCM 16511]|uniref:Putative protease n=1 Tax=Ignavibacterium album (strain DSM 19864 / JCM 16511 / NBRC 101810 / Mat9-16) TaxID=945713 RepID=I0APF2_IGNAJ|nr:peptidase U32 family protein [Ignavibacterium album]AFH50859.1 Putative protease [Ignavibacterium album JCM 16511]
MKSFIKKPELMAPAGDWTMLRAAVHNGADAVYFGVDKLNMRAKAKNFSADNLPEIATFCKENNVKTYLTLNTIVFEEEISEVEDIIIKAKEAGIDRIICWDLAVAELCYKHNFPFAISTQGSISNSLAASVYKRLGAVRIVLARECSLEEIKKIRANTDLEIEAFVHGAMCIAISGRCFMSHHLFGQSANRGECVQPCRREYEVIDSATEKSLIIGEDYVMSRKDLCTIEFIDQLIEAGIDSFKIEGRKRAPEYVAKVVSVYRNAIDLYFEGKLNTEKKKEFLTELETVYNRGFSSGFYFGVPSSEDYAGVEGSKATTRKVYVGKVLNYYKQPQVVHILIESGKIKNGDKILFIGETTGVIEIIVNKMFVNEVENNEAVKGSEVTLRIPTLVRRNDKVYLIETVR